MEYVIGGLVGAAVAAFAALAGWDRDRSFYPTVLVVVASYYALFAAMGASTGVLEIECAVGVGFAALATIGHEKSAWLVAAAIAGHGLFDLVHHLFIANAGMPVWWPGFCATADFVLGGWLGIRLMARSRLTRPARAA